MKSPFVFKGTSSYDGETTYNYLYKKMGVVVSTTDYSYEKDCNLSDSQVCLHISFSSPNGKFKQNEIDICLSHFGMNLNEHFFCFDKVSALNSQMLIRHYEQIQNKQ